MSEPKSANSDPSMDDILASIRKIISDDEARAQVTAPQAGNRPAIASPMASPTATRGDAQPQMSGQPASGHDDVLLLTDMIEPPRSEAMVAKPIPLRRIDPARAAEMPQPSFESPAQPPISPVSVAPAAIAPTPDTPMLIGGGTVDLAASAFARLHQVVQDSVPQPAAPDPGPFIGGNGKTVEDLVKEMLRPMLKEWLDRNLPPMVERHVEREIARLTRR